MKTMKWLIRRELWEHKGSLLWAPLIIGGIMCFFTFLHLGSGTSVTGISQRFIFNGAEFTYNGAQSGATAMGLNPEQIASLAHIMSTAYMAISAPLFLVLSFVMFSYCLNALYDERRDRSILFWKSLPVSDAMTVLSKVTVAVLVAPLITIVIGTVTAIFILLISAAALASKGINVFDIILTSPSFYLAPFELVGLVPVYILWALPTIGWLLMVSSWARSKVMLWAIGVPVLMTLLLFWAEKMFGIDLNIGWVSHHIAQRLLLGVLPGGWIFFRVTDLTQLVGAGHSGIDLAALFTQSWSSLNRLETWVDAVIGVAMIYAAIRMRRWREEG